MFKSLSVWLSVSLLVYLGIFVCMVKCFFAGLLEFLFVCTAAFCLVHAFVTCMVICLFAYLSVWLLRVRLFVCFSI